MFYRQTEPDQLTRAQMDMARKAFRGKLVRLRFSPQFVLNNADELLAIAHGEYVRAVQQGTEMGPGGPEASPSFAFRSQGVDRALAKRRVGRSPGNVRGTKGVEKGLLLTFADLR